MITSKVTPFKQYLNSCFWTLFPTVKNDFLSSIVYLLLLADRSTNNGVNLTYPDWLSTGGFNLRKRCNNTPRSKIEYLYDHHVTYFFVTNSSNERSNYTGFHLAL